MRRFIIGSLALTAAGTLAGCSQSSPTTTPTTATTSYGYRAAPRASASPNRFGSLPARTEAPSHTESVQGFPAGHPLHQDNTYMDNEPVQHQADENALPHTDYSY